MFLAEATAGNIGKVDCGERKIIHDNLEGRPTQSAFSYGIIQVLIRYFISPDTITFLPEKNHMLVKTFGSAVYGVEAINITIEVNVSMGQHYTIVGLPDNAVRESLQRTESAIKTNNYFMPRTKIVVNLAPADIRKSGSAFDLPIAMGILGASEQLAEPERLKDYVIMGELSLDGMVQPIKGALPIAIQARKEGFKGLIVPLANAREAGMVNTLEVYGVEHLKEVVDFFADANALQPVIVNTREEFFGNQYDFDIDFNEVKGQENIKRAMEIAAAGGHNAILIGPPGAGYEKQKVM